MFGARRLISFVLSIAVASAAMAGCTSEESELLVELRTDLVPIGEFNRVRTSVRRGGESALGWEQEIGAEPDGNYVEGMRVAEFTGVPTGDLVVRVELFGPDGRQFIERSVRVAYQGSVGVMVVITRSCRGVTCPESPSVSTLTECLGGNCVSPECVAGQEDACGPPQCTDAGDCETPASCAAAVCEAGVCFAFALVGGCPPGEYCDGAEGCLPLPGETDAGVPDGGAGGCLEDAECEDGLPCTANSCVDGDCESAPDDALCTDATGGTCIAGFGCQYDGCTAESCVGGPCEAARCDGDTCVIESACTPAEMCCGEACVSLGCDDGNACTDDACGAAGCENTPNAALCDDGVFCNGQDTCGGGSCSVHAGDPCSGGTMCVEAAENCVGCVADADCPADTLGAWSACGSFSGTCDETGTRSRSRTSYSCSAGSCVPSNSTDTEACSRSTGGLSCGGTTFSGWGACGGYSGTCGETGTRTRTRTDRVCVSGTCQDQDSPDVGSCNRDTDGTSCSATTYGPWGSCSGYASTCDNTGTRTRSMTTYSCVAGSCAGSTGTDSEGCSRNTNGTMCGTTMFGPWGNCGGYGSTCGENGTRSRTQTDRVCASGTCTDSVGTDSEACTRNTDGNTCSNFPGGCRRGNCSGGSCNLIGSECSGSQTCCEPGICVCSSCECP